jgi:hypothetical protein
MTRHIARQIIGILMVLAHAGAPAIAEPKGQKGRSDQQVRYFDLSASIFSELNAEALLKEVRQGTAVISAELEVCHLTSSDSSRLDRFVVPLKVEGTRLVGTGQSQEDKKPVSVNLLRRSLAKGSFNFEGTVRSGDTIDKVSATDNSDMSEDEMREQFVAETAIDAAPADFTAAWPQTLAVRVGRTNLGALLEAVRGQKARVAFNSVTPSCRLLRSGHYTVQIDVEPESAATVLARLKAVPGVAAAGFIANQPNMQRAVRFPSAGWRDADGRLARDKLGSAIGAAMARAMAAKVTSTSWDGTLGDLTVEMTRPAEPVAGLKLTQVVTVTGVIAPESPSSHQRSILWIETIAARIVEDRAPPRIEFALPAADDNDEEQSSEPDGSDDLPEAVAAALKGQTWDADKERWR